MGWSRPISVRWLPVPWLRGPSSPPIVLDLKTPLPTQLQIGRGQTIFLTGWLRHPGAPPRSAMLVADGLSNASPVTMMGRRDCPLFSTLTDGDTAAHATAFYTWLEIPATFPDRKLSAQLLLVRHDGTTQTCNLGVIRVNQTEPAPVVPAPRVAICMATFNPPPELFARQIESIRQQFYGNWACYISDDDSSPEALARMREILGCDTRFQLHAYTDRLGFYANFERALGIVPTGAQFVALSDQDDCWYPEKLGTLLDAFTSSDTTLVYSDMRIVDSSGRRLADSFWEVRKNCWTNLASLMLANTVTGAASMFRRNLLDRILPFPTKLGDQMYHDHWIAATALASGRIRFVPRRLYDYVQ